MRCEAVGKVLYVDDDTIHSWNQRYEADGLKDGLPRRGRPLPAERGPAGEAEGVDR